MDINSFYCLQEFHLLLVIEYTNNFLLYCSTSDGNSICHDISINLAKIVNYNTFIFKQYY